MRAYWSRVGSSSSLTCILTKRGKFEAHVERRWCEKTMGGRSPSMSQRRETWNRFSSEEITFLRTSVPDFYPLERYNSEFLLFQPPICDTLCWHPWKRTAAVHIAGVEHYIHTFYTNLDTFTCIKAHSFFWEWSTLLQGIGWGRRTRLGVQLT